MTEPTIHGLSNEQYHRGEEERQYLSSSLLKKYLVSPKYFKYSLDHPEEEKSDALRFGSLFHLAMEKFQQYGTIDAFYDSVAIFKPPVNPKTGQPYGATTKAYTEAYSLFLADNNGKEIATLDEVGQIDDMVGTLVRPCVGGATARQVLKLLKWGQPEVSFFYEFTEKDENGEDVTIRLKVRPDLLTDYKIIDWKTVSTDDLSEESINRIILKYGYHISAAMYQWVVWKVTGVWRDFYLVIVSKTPPYDSIMVNMCNYGYRYYPDIDMVVPGPGAMEFKKLLDLHIKCTKEDHWPGAEQAIPDNNGVRILEIQPPRYYQSKFIEEI